MADWVGSEYPFAGAGLLAGARSRLAEVFNAFLHHGEYAYENEKENNAVVHHQVVSRE
jgi:hypothetical protein|tara:strand:+ start:10546 stop:10719 length:174 start_codon:yes stop_codon:yes gene_type:complete